MITFDQFVAKYITSKNPIDYDNAFGGECIDLVKFHLDEVLGYKSKKIGNANELAVDRYKVLSQFYYKLYSFTALKKGDIVFLDTGISYAHVGYILEDLGAKIRIFDQIGNGDKVGGELPPRARTYKKSLLFRAWRLNINEGDIIDKRVIDFAIANGITPPSKTEPYTQHQILIILSKIHGN